MNILIFFISLSLLAGCNKKESLLLPLSEQNVWIYDVTGFLSADRFPPPPRPGIADTLKRDSFRAFEIPKRDTIRVHITKVIELGKDSVLYKLSEEFVRFWGSDILHIKQGYVKFPKHPETSFLIKFPIKTHHQWVNRFPYILEKCRIVSVDTTIGFDGHKYSDCIAINIQQSREGKEHRVEAFFNEKYGLVYYKDRNSTDEIKLLRMEVK